MGERKEERGVVSVIILKHTAECVCVALGFDIAHVCAWCSQTRSFAVAVTFLHVCCVSANVASASNVQANAILANATSDNVASELCRQALS